MYVDAHDRVMAANVIGMILHADGGYMATKPYAAGAGYIKKMSNYCVNCVYKPDHRTGPDACPFNYLYWNFYASHEDRFAKKSTRRHDDQDVAEQARTGKARNSDAAGFISQRALTSRWYGVTREKARVNPVGSRLFPSD